MMMPLASMGPGFDAAWSTNLQQLYVASVAENQQNFPSSFSPPIAMALQPTPISCGVVSMPAPPTSYLDEARQQRLYDASLLDNLIIQLMNRESRTTAAHSPPYAPTPAKHNDAVATLLLRALALQKEQATCAKMLDNYLSALLLKETSYKCVSTSPPIGFIATSTPQISLQSPYGSSNLTDTTTTITSPSFFHVDNKEVQESNRKTGRERTDSRPHKCDRCDKSFRFKSNLFEHKSLHSAAQRAFVCPFCAKMCRLKGNLKKHLQVHVNTVDDLERLWKSQFSRASGRPRKNGERKPLPCVGENLGLVPIVNFATSTGGRSQQASNQKQNYLEQQQLVKSVQWVYLDSVDSDSRGSSSPIIDVVSPINNSGDISPYYL